MSDKSFGELLNEQVAHEFAAHQQYVAIAVYYDSETLPRLAAFYYRQAIEERNHAMMIIQYLLDADHRGRRSPAVEAPQTSFADIVAPSSSRSPRRSGSPSRSTRSPRRPARRATTRASSSCSGSSRSRPRRSRPPSDLLKVVERARENPLLAEEYLARESLGEEGADPTAPAAAGGRSDERRPAADVGQPRRGAQPARSDRRRRRCAAAATRSPGCAIRRRGREAQASPRRDRDRRRPRRAQRRPRAAQARGVGGGARGARPRRRPHAEPRLGRGKVVEIGGQWVGPTQDQRARR